MPEIVVVYGNDLECYTIAELAKELRRSVDTIRKLERKGILPEANLRKPGNTILKGDRTGEVVPGERLYTKQTVEELVKIFANITQGVKISFDQKSRMTKVFQDELNYINNLK